MKDIEQNTDPTNPTAKPVNITNAITKTEFESAKTQASQEHAASEQTWEISQENLVDSPPVLPENALAAQEKFKDESTRCFVLYGRGKYDYGITPNTDMQLFIDVSPISFKVTQNSYVAFSHFHSPCHSAPRGRLY